jgi:hypothetical protein
MPSLTRVEAGPLAAAIAELEESGILGPRDLPSLVVPDDPRTLDGWSFA